MSIIELLFSQHQSKIYKNIPYSQGDPGAFSIESISWKEKKKLQAKSLNFKLKTYVELCSLHKLEDLD